MNILGCMLAGALLTFGIIELTSTGEVVNIFIIGLAVVGFVLFGHPRFKV